jgi:uncharacterized protein YjbI with pentapeptide repeats
LEAEAMTAEELLERYAAGERDFSGVELTNISLIRAKLSEIDLTNASLTNIDLTESNLSSANLTGAKLTKITLTGVNLAGVNLTDTDLRGTINFDFSTLMGNALLWNTILPDGTIITGKIYTEE